MPYGVLIVEDETVLAKNISNYLMRAGYDCHVVDRAEQAFAELERFKPEAVLLDFNLPGMNGVDAIDKLRAIDPKLKIIMITGHGSVELAVDAMKAGAYDFLTKPISLSKLKLLLDKALSEARQTETLSYYQAREAHQGGLDKLIGESAPMRRLREALRQLIRAEESLQDTDAPAVLIAGETGTGKDLVARALHTEGPRRNQPFVEVNCASIPSQLLESELFGYERGAFTDARARKLGLVETASEGTLFLDEIGDMELSLQAKLLKLLEEKTVRRIGSLRDQQVNVRIIAATHRPLERLVEEGRFRSDLYFRLRIVHLQVPPLRAREDDVLLLAKHFLSVQGKRYRKPDLALTAEAQAKLREHNWPGNVRELRNVMEQAVLMTSDPLIHSSAISLVATRSPDAESGDVARPRTLDALERSALLDALEQTDWNVTKAARLLGISRDTLRYRIEKFQIVPRG
jgi:DNA-binding NtrC family response regulator